MHDFAKSYSELEGWGYAAITLKGTGRKSANSMAVDSLRGVFSPVYSFVINYHRLVDLNIQI